MFHELMVFLNQRISTLERNSAGLIGADPVW